MAWGIRGSKNCNEQDENKENDINNNFDDSNKKLLRTIWQWRGPKTSTKTMKTIILSKITKTCGMQWHQAWEDPKSPTKWWKWQFCQKWQKHTESNDMGLERVQRPQQKWWKRRIQRFSRKLQKSCWWVQGHDGWQGVTFRALITWWVSARLNTLKFQTGFWNKSSENQVVDYMDRDSGRGAIQPGLKILAWYSQTGLGFSAGQTGWKIHVIAIIFSARAEKGARACVSIVYLHLSKLSYRNLCFVPGLKLTM